MSEDNQIAFNRKVSNEVRLRYERLHGEIFNPIEQSRLRKTFTHQRWLSISQKPLHDRPFFGKKAGKNENFL